LQTLNKKINKEYRIDIKKKLSGNIIGILQILLP
jgi:hypothetical protein